MEELKMMEQNYIENSNILSERNKKNKDGIKYEIPLPETLARKIDRFIETFQTSYEVLFNYLLAEHFYILHYQIKEEEYQLLISYYLCVDEIFSENNDPDYESSDKSKIKTQNIYVKITEEYDTVIKEICEKMYYKPELFISKAIQRQWENIKSNIDAGWYYIIDDFCNISKIKQTLEKFLKRSKASKKLSKNEDVNNGENKSK